MTRPKINKAIIELDLHEYCIIAGNVDSYEYEVFYKGKVVKNVQGLIISGIKE